MSKSFLQAATDSNQIICYFVTHSKESSKIEQPILVAQEILQWTEGNSLLTKNICQIILERQDQVIKGQETTYVRRIVNSLVKDWEIETNQDYYQHFKAIKDCVLKNQRATTVLFRLQEILLKKEVVTKESSEDLILLESKLVVRQEECLKIANPIYAEIFNSEWIIQQLNQISSQLMSSSEIIEVNSDRKKSLKSSKLRKILALTSLVGLAGMVGLHYYRTQVKFSDIKQCSLVPTDLNLAVKVLDACDRVLKHKSNNTEALINRGKVSLVLWNTSRNPDRINSAVADFTRARELEPNNPRAAFYQSYIQEFKDVVIGKVPRCLPAKDRYQAAIKLYQPWNTITELDVPIILELGHFLINREQDYQTAAKIFDAAIGFDPSIVQAWSSKATAQFLAKDYFNAQVSFDQALALNPDSHKIKYNLGSLWARLGNYRKASELYKQATEIEPDFAVAWRDLGLSLYLQDRYRESALAFTQIVYRPNSESFQVDNKERKLVKDYYERVEDCLEQAIEGLKVSCSQEDRIPVEVALKHNGIFHNVIVHEESFEPFFKVEHHKFLQCVPRNSETLKDGSSLYSRYN